MAKERELPPPLEMACLNALWELKEGNVEEVRVLVSQGVSRGESRDRPLAYTTVLTLLDRLSRRGAVSRRKEGRGFRYQPSIERDKLRRLALAQLLDHHFGGSAEALRLFLENGNRSPEDAVGADHQAVELAAPDAPAPQAFTNHYEAPAPQAFINQYDAPAPQAFRNQYDVPAPQAFTNQFDAPAPQGFTNQYDAPAPQAFTNQYDAPAPQAFTNQYDAPAPQAFTNQYDAPAPAHTGQFDGHQDTPHESHATHPDANAEPSPAWAPTDGRSGNDA